MPLALHTGIFAGTGLLDILAIARQSGYEGVELQISDLLEYSRQDADPAHLTAALDGLHVCMADALIGVERADAGARGDTLRIVERIVPLLHSIGCQMIQVVALDAFPVGNRRSRIDHLVQVLNELAAVAAPFGIRYALEPVCFSSFHSLEDALGVVARVGTGRVGLVLDTWHLWTTGADWRAVAELDASVVASAHLADGLPMSGVDWSDEDRAVAPGQGIVPLDRAIRAIGATGYAGWWTVEVHGRPFGPIDPASAAARLRVAAMECLARAGAMTGGEP